MTHKKALLALLSDHRPHHMRQLLDVAGFRYGGRLHELRREGHVIETHQLGPGEFEYRLASKCNPSCLRGIDATKPKQGVLV